MKKYFESDRGLKISLGAIAALPTIYAALQKNNYLLVAIIVGCFFFIIGSLSLTRRPKRKQLRSDTYYDPFNGEKPVWPREDEVNRIKTLIDDSEHKVIIVTGPSGAGKSVLLSKLLPEALDEKCEYINNYDGHLDISDDSEVVILDQFEHKFLKPEEQSSSWLRSVINVVNADLERLMQGSKVLVIGIREDKYYYLQFLQDLPVLSNTVVLNRIDRESDPQLLEDFINSLNFDHGRHFSIDGDKGYTLLELQAYGSLMEQTKKPPEMLLQKSPTEALADLIGIYIDASPDKSMSTRVLYALRQSPVSLHERELAHIIDDDEEEIKQACSFFETAGIVRRTGKLYELAYDALRIPIDICATERLEPNWVEIIQNSTNLLLKNSKVFDEDDLNDTKPRIKAVYVAMILLCILAVPRTFFWLDGWHDLSVNIASFIHLPSFIWENIWTITLDNDIELDFFFLGIDVFYAGIVLPHIFWCYYISSQYIKIFSHRDRTWRQRMMSIITLVFMAICIFVAMILPHFWFSAIAFGGMIYGIKCFSVSRGHSLNQVARIIYGRRAVLATLFMMLHFIGGGFFAWGIWSDKLEAETAILFNFSLAFVFSVEFLAMYVLHFAKARPAFDRGLLRPSFVGQADS